MQIYKAPLRDMRFVLNELLDVGELSKMPGYEDATPDVIDAMIEEGAKLCENRLLPLNRTADEEGCHFENGVVRTPEGFKEAYNEFVKAGWMSVSNDPAYGGQGLPELLNSLPPIVSDALSDRRAPEYASQLSIDVDFVPGGRGDYLCP